MISPEKFYQALALHKVNYFTGVPDSLLKHFCAYITDNVSESNHTIASNEGSAMALAIGYHLATAKVPLVYMQNSGLGNIVNPLTSLVDPAVYSVPMLLMVGWRGEPGVKDEPQHVKQGAVTLSLLEALEIPYTVLKGTEDNLDEIIADAIHSATLTGGAHGLVIKKNSFAAYSAAKSKEYDFGWSREDAIKMIVDALTDDDIVVCTTGMASRELFEYRELKQQGHEMDFLTVGGMGYASQIALGIASQKTKRKVVCIDGDGAALMHLGALATIGLSKLTNFRHIVINNGAHDSVGGQPTTAFSIQLAKIASACGYTSVNVCDNSVESAKQLKSLFSQQGPCLLELKVNTGSRKDLGRPTSTPVQNKLAFMRYLKG